MALNSKDDGLFSAGIDCKVGLWDIKEMKLLDTIECGYKINALTVLKDQQVAIGGTSDGTNCPIDIINIK